MDVMAERFAEIDTLAALEAINDYDAPIHVLGGGSNILLKGAVQGLVLRNRLMGRTRIQEDATHVWLQVQSGEAWHQLVMHTVNQGLGGIENLALIPGTVGAAPIQNIGAYGVEVKDTITAVTFWRWDDRQYHTFTNQQCNFGYRDSIFKHELAGKVFITSVVFCLQKVPTLHTSYGAITHELEKHDIATPTVREIAEAVIRIRTSKLPDPTVTGNAGSFFKNPTVPMEQYNELLQVHSSLPMYPAGAGMVKVPAGWLIEQAGWKGYREGDACVHPLQALVLCNYGAANGTEIWNLSQRILESVQQRYGIVLEREVQVWG
jgi:UDP-N-acetylmuramate dehydrogenase